MENHNTSEHLLSSPTAAHWRRIGTQPRNGIVVPLFSLHSQSSCGIGEYPDLLPLIPWCKRQNFTIIQLLPLNDTGHDTSPYSALSAFALNPLHLGLSSLPNSENDPSLKIQLRNLQKLNPLQRVDYASVRLGKEQFLREYYHKYGTQTTTLDSYKAFKTDNRSWLAIFTLFKSLKVLHGWQSWEFWPQPYRDPSEDLLLNLTAELSSEMEFHAFVQYHCFEQFIRVKKTATEAGLFVKGDIPILINRDSADVWYHRNLFLLDYSAGAPPDMYAQEGQKWGFPLYNWENVAAEGYRWWIERLKAAAHCYHIYRIDHIVGFFRIWAIPVEKIAKEGFFIPADPATWIAHGEVIMKMMIENSDMLPIGEDLGTVPPEVRICLKELGICGTKVMRWERRWNSDGGFIDPKSYPPESMTTVSTHDSETLALWWQNQPDEAKLYAETFGLPYSPELSVENRKAILDASNTSGSIFHINLLQEYLALYPGMSWPNLEDERINIPGVISESNWSYKFRPTCEEICTLNLHP